MNSIIFIGMPGSGKSTVARLLSERIGMPWYDTDADIAGRAGMPVSRIFELHGEDYFRKLETGSILGFSMVDQIIIATGGGAVLRNCGLIRRFKHVICLRRPLEEIIRCADSSGRPLMRGSTPGESRLKLYELHRKRRGFYERCCDFSVDNSGDPGETVDCILYKLS